MTILVLQCKNHAFENQDHTSQIKLFAVSVHLFSSSACYVLTTVLAALVRTLWLNIPGAELPVILNTVL